LTGYDQVQQTLFAATRLRLRQLLLAFRYHFWALRLLVEEWRHHVGEGKRKVQKEKEKKQQQDEEKEQEQDQDENSDSEKQSEAKE